MTEQTTYLEILSVTKVDKKSIWSRIGTAFPTKDGRGYRLKITLIPQGQNSEILMLLPRSAAMKPDREEQ